MSSARDPEFTPAAFSNENLEGPTGASVVVIGGGLAGIAAATALADAGRAVTLLEARNVLGGRATSYVDRMTGESIDNCQHVSMRCCSNLRDLMSRLGLASEFRIEKELHFVGPSGTVTRFRADPVPAPFHLSRAFLTLPYLSLKEKCQFALAVKALAKASPSQLVGKDFLTWLREQKQSDHLIACVWEVVLVSALSESLDRIDAAYARKVFVDGFLANSDGWQVEIPNIDLNELYSVRTQSALQQKGVKLQLGARIQSLQLEGPRIQGVSLQGGEFIPTPECVLAVPQHQLGNILPEHSSLKKLREQVSKIETAPIASAHLWYDRVLTDLPHAVLIKRLGQWLFNRGPRNLSGQQTHYYQVVISASRNLTDSSQPEVISALNQELQEIWKHKNPPNLIHSRLVTERRAVFSVTPGIDELRPRQQTSVENLQLAGDWTQTGWPSTMEGAVISGYLAAKNILRTTSENSAIVKQGLPIAMLPRWLYGLRESQSVPVNQTPPG